MRKAADPYLMKSAIAEAHGHPVFTLPCGQVGTLVTLYRRAVAIGFNGTRKCFGDRFHKAGGTMTLAQLAEPVQKVSVPKRDNSEVMEAIRALDARKAAMK